MLEFMRVANLYSRAVARNKQGKPNEATAALLEAVDILVSPRVKPSEPWVLSLSISISISKLLGILGPKVGRAGIERAALAQGLRALTLQAGANPRLRDIEEIAEWEAWARRTLEEPRGPASR